MGDEKNAIDYAYRVSGYNRARVLSGLYGLHGENEREEAERRSRLYPSIHTGYRCPSWSTTWRSPSKYLPEIIDHVPVRPRRGGRRATPSRWRILCRAFYSIDVLSAYDRSVFVFWPQNGNGCQIPSGGRGLAFRAERDHKKVKK